MHLPLSNQKKNCKIFHDTIYYQSFSNEFVLAMIVYTNDTLIPKTVILIRHKQIVMHISLNDIANQNQLVITKITQ